jgi:hypothetical protein
MPTWASELFTLVDNTLSCDVVVDWREVFNFVIGVIDGTLGGTSLRHISRSNGMNSARR